MAIMHVDAPWTDGFVTTDDGAKLHYLEAGTGPSLLFVPGWIMPAEVWACQMRFFAATHRVVAMDPRGQGRSSKTDRGLYPEARGEDIHALIQRLRLAPTVVVAWSMAVLESLAMIQRHGTASLRGLVLVDGHAGLDPTPDLLWQGLQWMCAFLRDRPAAAQTFAGFLFRQPVDAELVQYLVKRSSETRTDTAVALMVGAMGANFQEVLPRIHIPTLVVAAPGPWVPVIRQMANRIPHAQFVVLKPAGHALFLDRADAFNNLLATFLAEHAA